MPSAQHLRLRCFIEGIEVPIISASVSIQPDSPAQCQVQIVATDKGHDLLPRSLIHVFFADFYDGPEHRQEGVEEAAQVSTSDVAADEENRTPETTDPDMDTFFDSRSGSALFEGSDEAVTSDETDVTLDRGPQSAGPTTTPELTGQEEDTDEEPSIADSRWKLFFCGEIMGYQFVKSVGQRAIILTCMDLSVMWDTCYQYQVDVASLHGNGTANFVGAGTNLFDTFFQSSTSTLVDIVMQRSRARPELTGLLSGIVHLLERVGGVYNNRGFRGVNDFFTMAELRYHLIDMIGASEDDNSSQRLFPRQAFNRWTRGSGGRLGKIASFRDILGLLCKFIFHNTFPCPIAYYQRPDTIDRTRTVAYSSTQQFSSTAEWRELNGRIDTHWRSFNSYVGSNTPISSGRVSRQLDSLATQIVATKDAVQQHSARYSLASATNALHHAGQEVRALASHLSRVEGDPEGGDVTYSSWAAGSTPAPRIQRARDGFRTAIQALQGGSHSSSGNRERTDTVVRHGRLYSQIIRPDIFMCAPPCCNVLFPELYSSFQFSRQYMREVTRMRLTVSDEIFGPDVLLNSVYFAPDVEVLGARVQQGRHAQDNAENATLSRAAYGRRLMEHELYTGPIPVFERMNEVNIMAARGAQTNFRGARVPYAMRAAHFQFYKNRWSSRSMAVTGKFNPWAVCGFPAVVVDRYMNEEQLILSGLRGQRFLEEAFERDYPGIVQNADDEFTYDSEWGALDAWDILKNTVPTQFVGLIMGLTHQISQNSASTSYQFTASRVHRDNDVLLGANRIRASAPPVRREHVGTVSYTATGTGSRAQSDIQGHLNALNQYAGAEPGSIADLSTRLSVLASGIERTKRALEGSGDRERNNLQSAFQDLHQAGRSVLTMARLSRMNDSGGGTSFAYEVDQFDRATSTARNRLQSALDIVQGASSRRRSVAAEVEEPDEIDVPLEDFIRPPWMADIWANDRIGGVYQQFFGTGAITDPSVISTGYETAVDTMDAAAQDADEDRPLEPIPSELGLGTEGEDPALRPLPSDLEDPGSLDPIRQDGRAVQNAEMGISVQRAIDLLIRSYSAIKAQEGMDINEFVRAYTWRPVANMTDILGGRDLTIDSDTGVATGQEGFHSRAFGSGPNGRNLRNLLPPDSEGRPVRRILGISTESSSRLEDGREAALSEEEKQQVSDALVRLDTRADKADRVLDYVSDLWASRGLLG